MVERRTFLTGLATVGAATLLGCGGRGDDGKSTPRTSATPPAETPDTPSAAVPTSTSPRVAATVASGLNVPWGIAFLANGDALVSQRDEGTVVRISTEGKVTTLGEVGGVVGGTPGGEGGLLGIALAPGDESTLFAYITAASDNRVVRMRLSDNGLGKPVAILPGIPTSLHHHGGRLLFDAQGRLYVSTGDAEQSELAQDKGSFAGKIMRITQDGAAATGNPFDNRTWSYGHRNIEGLAFDARGRLWATEFGDKKSDELNLIAAGGNYGWPNVEGRSGAAGYLDPKAVWQTDECSPSGLAITRSTAFVGALQGECVFAVPLKAERAGTPKAYFAGDEGRIRSVTTAPDGALWVTTSNTDGRRAPGKDDDRILRVTL
ncbi:PQQ-dependent sugar dehydrogenase [Aeromicrobium sp.]|uniref:PQQ-dependent sugar dehydrogenase n=1 Tax=Aeromicrobium sp. TaxID=1871063 RepID=UPI0019B0FA6E|nr:PQQ-dependent sugar dehydrogenase [Aeromicrobium sp.]MBC7630605.1 PQQ-dependent sugar dehydrogenase [Aeromicrobium sp.]